MTELSRRAFTRSRWITRATVFVVAAAPCAFVISIPITLVATLGTAARRGVLIKGGVYVEELSKIQTVALDKTGTLTRGEPAVTDVIVLRDDGLGDDASARELVALVVWVQRELDRTISTVGIGIQLWRGVAYEANAVNSAF